VALRPKQQRFVEEYLVDLNATQAALRAGYSPKNAGRIGREQLANPPVAAAIRAANAARAQRTALTADRVLAELAALAFSDMRQHATWGPEGVALLPSAALSDEAARAVHEVVSTTKTRTHVTTEGESIRTVEVQTRLRLYNKLQALEALGKHLDLFRAPTEDELANQAFIEALAAVVLKHVTAHEAREEIRAVIEAHVRTYRLRYITPTGAR
jgi:phage terminase small subunit